MDDITCLSSIAQRRRTKNLSVRFDEEEYQHIVDAASKENISVSNWIRKYAVDAVDRKAERFAIQLILEDQQFLKAALVYIAEVMIARDREQRESLMNYLRTMKAEKAKRAVEALQNVKERS